MIGQHDIKPNQFDVPQVRYGAIATCLKKVYKFSKTYTVDNKISIHMPRIGCGLAGGSWVVMEAVIKNSIPDDIEVFVYDF